MVSISVVAKSCVLAVPRNRERGWRLGSSNTEVTVLASAGRTYSATGSGTRGGVDCPSSGIIGMWGRLREELVFWLRKFLPKAVIFKSEENRSDGAFSIRAVFFFFLKSYGVVLFGTHCACS